MVAVIIGSSGMVGQHLLHQLCACKDFTEIVLFVRTPSGNTHPKVREVVVDFDQLENYKEQLKGDAVFCCLGTGRSKPTAQKNYYKIDYEYPVKIAWLAAENKVAQFHIISAMGAAEKSSNPYLKIKGETEINISVIKFESTHFYRPSVMEGAGDEKKGLQQLGLLAMKVVNPFLLGSAKKYRTIEASDVAKAMVTQSIKHLDGTFYYESDEIQALANHAG